MKHITIIKILTLCGMALSTSCAIYHPQLGDIPLIREKGDTRIDLGISLTPPVVRTSVSYGLTESIAVQVAGNFMGEPVSDNRYYVQGATGLYKHLQNGNVMELYGGFGYGYGFSDYGFNARSLSGNYQAYFTQFNYGVIRGKNKNTELAFGLKMGYLHTNVTKDKDRSDGVNYDRRNENGVFLEPTTLLRTGGEKLKFQIGLGGCWEFKINRTERFSRAWPFNLGLGINYRL